MERDPLKQRMGTAKPPLSIVQKELDVLRALLSHTQAQLAYLDSNLNFVEVNAAYANGSGYTREQLIGRNHFELFPNAENLAIFERAVATGEPVAFHAKPFTFQRPDLGITYWDWTLTPDKDRKGQVQGLVLSLVDVTERERARQRGRAHLAQLETLIRVLQVLSATTLEDVQQAPVDAARELTGGRIATSGHDYRDGIFRVGAVSHAEGVSPCPPGEADQAIPAGRSAQEIAEATLPYIQQLLPCERIGISLFDLSADWVSLLAVSVSGKTQMPTGWAGRLSDTAWPAELATGKIRVVEDLSSQRPLSPFENTLLAEGLRSWTNVPLIVEGQLLGSLNLGTRTPGRLPFAQMDVMREMADELAVGLLQANLHGEIERHARELEDRVAARTADLQASRARLQAVFDGATIGIALVNRQGHILEHNTAMGTLFGYPAAELHSMAVLRLLHPDDIDDDLATGEAWAKGSPQRRSLRMLRKDGELLWVNLDVSGLAGEAGGQSIVMIEDVTATRQAQENLVQSEKLTIAGRLAASWVHEISNPLQSVIGCLSLVEEAEAEGGDISRYLQVAREELKRAAGIIGRLRDVYTPSKPEDRKPADINGLVEHVLTLTQKRCEDSGVRVTWRPGKGLSKVKLVHGSMQQVFLNLVLNAVDAMPLGGRLQVSTRHVQRPTGVLITITDSGGGVPAEALPHLFEPFHTSKADGPGLGLFITHRIVEEHGGRISVESQTGVGSTFRVWLPV